MSKTRVNADSANDGSIAGSRLEDGAVTDDKVNAAADIDAGKIVYTQSGTGAVERTLEARLSEEVSLLDFGADPTGVEDSTQALIDALATGKPIFAPNGEYKITREVDCPEGTRIRGVSQARARSTPSMTLFRFVPATDSDVVMFRVAPLSQFISFRTSGPGVNQSILHRCFDLDDNNPPTNSERQVVFDMLEVREFSEAAYVLSGQWCVTIRNCRIFSCGSRSAMIDKTGGIVFKTSPVAPSWAGSGNTFIDVYIAGCSYGIWGESGWNITLINLIFEYNVYPLRRTVSGNFWVIQNCWFERNGQAPVIEGPTLYLGGRGASTAGVNMGFGSATCLVQINGNLAVMRSPENILFNVNGQGILNFKTAFDDLGWSTNSLGGHLYSQNQPTPSSNADLSLKAGGTLGVGMQSRNEWGRTTAIDAYGGWFYNETYRTQVTSGTITGATTTNPVVLTVASTSGSSQLYTGDIIEIDDVAGMTQLNGNSYRVTVLTPTTVQLDGVNGTGFGTYTSGGTWSSDRKNYRVAGVSVETYGTIGGNGSGNGRVVLSAGSHNGGGDNSFLPRFAAYTNRFEPVLDNSYSLGSAANRFSVVYAQTPSINTSDEREKQDVQELDEAEKRVAKSLKGLVKKFRYKSAVELKGDDARFHVGVIAQDVIRAFDSEGLDARAYGILCHDEWYELRGEVVELVDGDVPEGAEKKDRYGVRYEELLAFIISAL